MPDNKPPLSDNRRAKVGDFLLTPYERVIIPEVLRPWSISTAVRSPDRLRGFLSVLTQMEGREWNLAAQTSFQIRLIQARLFGAHQNQFYRGLSQSDIDLMESVKPISYKRAGQIFASKNYESPPMRGRGSFKPLEKFGFASLRKGCIRITATGKMLLAEDKDYGDIFLRAFLKWQLPNPLEPLFPAKQGYNIKPFVGVLRLIAAVNRLCAKAGEKQKGISFDEFRIFALSLIDWRKINKTAEEIMTFRRQLARVSRAGRPAFVEKAAGQFRPHFNLRHSRDYADNAVRYFRMTKYVSLRGAEGNIYIDLEPARKVELSSLFKRDNAEPISDFRGFGGSYSNWMDFASKPDLPGETDRELSEAIKLINTAIIKGGGVAVPIPAKASPAQKKKLRDKARAVRLTLIKQTEKSRLQNPDAAAELVAEMRQLSSRRYKGKMPPSLALEHLTTKILDEILNDAKEIRSNCPRGDDGEPTTTAPGGMADIECRYERFDAICEVTMLVRRTQWVHEAQPVMDHLLAFEKKQKGRRTYCLFIAPKIHKDSLNTFRFSATAGYEGMRQNFAPLSIEQFCDVADECIACMRERKQFTSERIQALLDMLARSVREMQTSDNWQRQIPAMIEKWKRAA